ncbi:MAG TPA: hypothetical protein PLY73_15695, partial [Candidatus Ozemobacteraceae bacterium]|nr:hypothetical protein [Candidatus Ozemobacteraceae bacterium]
MKSKMTRAAGLFLAVIALISLTLCTGCGNKQPAAGPAAPKIDRFGAADGLPHDVITALAVFGNQIWVGTKSGVARYDG